jgi:hypothetical protein
MLKSVALFICIITISAWVVPTVSASPARIIVDSPTNKNTHICPSDPNAPCYGVVFQQTSQATTSNSSQQLTCGINVYDKLGALVAEIWTNVNVIWDYPYSYDFDVTGKSRGTWVVNGSYGWTNLSGPSGSTGVLPYGRVPFYWSSSGTATFLGIPFSSFTATVVVTGSHQFYCRNY